jgi:hypothetical protein
MEELELAKENCPQPCNCCNEVIVGIDFIAQWQVLKNQ